MSNDCTELNGEEFAEELAFEFFADKNFYQLEKSINDFINSDECIGFMNSTFYFANDYHHAILTYLKPASENINELTQ